MSIFPAPNQQKLTVETGSGQMEPQEIIEDYLDHLCAPLVGIVPFRERDRLRDEAGFCIEERMKVHLHDGVDPVDAAYRAIEQYGQSGELTTRFIERWQRHQMKGFVTRRLGMAQAYATFFFGQAALWTYLVLQWRIFYPSSAGRADVGLTPGLLRELLPEPIPLPDASFQTYIFIGMIVLAPIIAGYFTGRFAILRAVQASYQVMVVLTLASFALGAAMLPSRDGLFLALAQLFWWLPVGCLSAYVAAAVEWRRRCAYQSFPSRRKS